MIADRMTELDVIGDIHGHADALESLLATLGYRQTAGVHPHARTSPPLVPSRLWT